LSRVAAILYFRVRTNRLISNGFRTFVHRPFALAAFAHEPKLAMNTNAARPERRLVLLAKERQPEQSGTAGARVVSSPVWCFTPSAAWRVTHEKR
jgi:hypothetical protein